ncbi:MULTISPECIES: hypothetical protein [unclassified Ensifer]|uniref:hypothetical protein n=1 Tax=unclassified Ensifer TaxID=2633371 RepID=UPI00300FB350
MIGGHFVLFAYLAPYITDRVGLGQTELVLAFVAFGVAGVSGGYLGGWLADSATLRRAIVITPLAYLLALLMMPAASSTPWTFIAAMMVWGCISWMISPVVQSFLLAAGPDTAEAGIGLNLSAMHVGVALGTALGGLTLAAVPPQALPLAGAARPALFRANRARLLAGQRDRQEVPKFQGKIEVPPLNRENRDPISPPTRWSGPSGESFGTLAMSDLIPTPCAV